MRAGSQAYGLSGLTATALSDLPVQIDVGDTGCRENAGHEPGTCRRHHLYGMLCHFQLPSSRSGSVIFESIRGAAFLPMRKDA